MMSHHPDITRYPYNILPPSTSTSLTSTKSNTASPTPISTSASNPTPTTQTITQSPTRPKHLTTRSISEVSSIHKDKSHHKHHHHPHLHHRDKDKELNYSVANLHPGLGLPEALGGSQSRSEGVTPAESRDASRRGSMMGVRDMEKERFEDSAGGGVMLVEKREVKEGEVVVERERVVQRAAELRNALIGLNTLSINTTRRLDNAYYSVLEKLGVLQSTISSLKELATLTRHLNDEFKSESEELVRDVTSQLEGFEQFSSQETRIAELAARVKAGRERIKTLGKRVDVVKERVEGWEKAEEEWQERTRKNLRMMWIVMAVVGGILLAIVAFQYTPAMNGAEGPNGLNTTGLLGKIPDFEILKNESRASKREVEEALEGSRKPMVEDPRLRAFDEL